jgi:flagellar motor switch protein FliN
MPDPTPPRSGDPLQQPTEAAEKAGGDSSLDAMISGDPNSLGGFNQADIDELLKQASFDDPGSMPASVVPPPSPAVAAAPQAPATSSAAAVADLPDLGTVQLPDFQQAIRDAQVSSIDLLRDVDLNVKIELGRSRMLVEDVLKLSEGSVVELDKLAGDPVDVFVNDRLVARGEVLVLNDNFCVRINEIVAGVKDEGV